jgi:hypothetical protein
MAPVITLPTIKLYLLNRAALARKEEK